MLAKGASIVYNIKCFLSYFMKNYSKLGILVLAGIFSVSFLAGCGPDPSIAVKAYNNSVVAIQKDMFNKAQDASKILEDPKADIQKVYSTLQSIQTAITSSHNQFAAVKVPTGAEGLSSAMESFYKVETQGISDVLVAVQKLQNSQNDPNVQQNFSDTFSKFSNGENNALNDFYATQQQVAQKYGQKVLDTNS